MPCQVAKIVQLPSLEPGEAVFGRLEVVCKTVDVQTDAVGRSPVVVPFGDRLRLG